MSDPIFVKLRNDQGNLYDSYTDYWRLIELSGFPTCEQNQIDHGSDNTYIFAPPNGNAHAIAAAPRSDKCRMICWSLERPTGGMDGFITPGYDNVWISDRWLAGEFSSNPRVRYVPMGGHPGLGGERLRTFRWDATHMSYVYGRRQRILYELSLKGIGVGDACWGRERDEQLASSRVGLCVHQDDPPLPILEPLRYVLFACWKIPIVVEYCHDYYPYHVFPLEAIGQAMTDGESMAEMNWRNMTQEITFRKCVEAAV